MLLVAINPINWHCNKRQPLSEFGVRYQHSFGLWNALAPQTQNINSNIPYKIEHLSIKKYRRKIK
jgi:uncharacterized protein YqcC (DUF446 family)